MRGPILKGEGGNETGILRGEEFERITNSQIRNTRSATKDDSKINPG